MSDDDIKTLSLLEANSEYQKLVQIIRKHDDLYYNYNAPIITDAEYDKLRRRLLYIEELYPVLKTSNSPSVKIGSPISKKAKPVMHLTPMLSLDNAFTVQDLEKFIARVPKLINVPIDALDYCCEQKIDGLSVSLIYDHGSLVQASTRGNGYVGEDVTANAMYVIDIPHDIPLTKHIEVRGEIYMPIKAFNEINKICRDNNEMEFVNPRNAAAGSLRQLDAQVTATRHLCFFAYYLEGLTLNTQIEVLQKLQELGFSVCSFEHCNTLEGFQKYFLKIQNLRQKLEYAIDGVVLKINNLSFQRQLGFAGRNPRHSIAYKFPAEQATTELIDIEVNVGRTGKITPVAILKPANIANSTITRATLHNFNEISNKNLNIGDIVIIERSGDVIPKIIGVQKKAIKPLSIIVPDACPACGSKLTKIDGYTDIFCPNRYGCSAQIVNYITYFASKPCFDIKGLGLKQVKELFDMRLIHSAIDLFDLKNDNNINILPTRKGWGITSVRNLLDAIDSSRNITLHRFINALGIPDIGLGQAKVLANEFNSVDLFMNATSEKLSNISGLGETRIQNITTFINNPINIEFVSNLLKYIKIV